MKKTGVLPSSILIVCFRFLGDVLITTPLVSSFKNAHPDIQIDYLVFKGTEGVLVNNPYIRKIISVPRNKTNLGIIFSLFRKYDLAIAAYPSDRSIIAAAIAGKFSIGLTTGSKKEWWKNLALDKHYVCYDLIHVVSNMLMPLRTYSIVPVPRVSITCDDNDLAFAHSRIPFRRYIILHPYSLRKYKYWPAENWAKLASLIQEQTGCLAVFTRTPESKGEEYLEQILKSSSQKLQAFDSVYTINQLAAIIRNSSAFVGIDTAITHIAAAMDIPTVAIFGPTLTRYWAPWPNDCIEFSPFAANKGIQHVGNVTVVQKNWSCIPCNNETCAISTRGAIECLMQLSEQEVLGALITALECFKSEAR